jgi:hypothetical protein
VIGNCYENGILATVSSPRKAGIQRLGADRYRKSSRRSFRRHCAPYGPWMPACAGMTTLGAHAAAIFIHNDAPEALVDCQAPPRPSRPVAFGDGRLRMRGWKGAMLKGSALAFSALSDRKNDAYLIEKLDYAIGASFDNRGMAIHDHRAISGAIGQG